jgi:hypothetical protein
VGLESFDDVGVDENKRSSCGVKQPVRDPIGTKNLHLQTTTTPLFFFSINLLIQIALLPTSGAPVSRRFVITLCSSLNHLPWSNFFSVASRRVAVALERGRRRS